jgi:hypothetical protein
MPLWISSCWGLWFRWGRCHRTQGVAWAGDRRSLTRMPWCARCPARAAVPTGPRYQSSSAVVLMKIIFCSRDGHDRVAVARLRTLWSSSTRFTLDTLTPNRWATCDLVAPRRTDRSLPENPQRKNDHAYSLVTPTERIMIPGPSASRSGSYADTLGPPRRWPAALP